MTTVVIAVLLSPINSAFAGCPTQSSEIYGPGGGTDLWSFDTTCASTSGNVSDGTMSCYSWPANQFGYGMSSAVYSMTVPTGYGGSTWSVSSYVDFDANGYNPNAVSGTVRVRHNGSVTYSANLFVQDGFGGSLYCNLFGAGYFSVSDGDTIEIEYDANNYGGGTIKVTPPIVFDH
jgi:hypothetical protein